MAKAAIEPDELVTLDPTGALSAAELRAVRRLLDLAYQGEFSDADWHHALGGTHARIRQGEEVLAHGSLIPRKLWVGRRPTRVGYVEAIGVLPRMHGHGLGGRIMKALAGVIERDFEMGALATGEPEFYHRFGWVRWQGPTFARHADGTRKRSKDADGGIMVLRTSRTPPLELTRALTCEARHGQAW
jgi:aminoglycoside 2'-N-acetyltransferase I